MNTKSRPTITVFVFLFFSCTQPQIKNDTKTDTTPTIGITMNGDTIKPPKILPAGQPKIIAVPPDNKLSITATIASLPNAHFINFNTEQGLALASISSGYYDKTGNLWFGTNGGGVSKYDGRSFTNFTTAQGLANNVVNSIVEDKAGNLWFATYGGGLSKYDGKSFINFATDQGLADNRVFSITKDKDGNLWFGTNGGVSKYNGKTFTNLTTAEGLVDNIVFNVMEDKDRNLWFGTHGGVSKYDGKSFTNFTTAQGLANNVVRSIAEDKAGNLWFGTRGGGVSKYNGKTFTNFTTAQGLANNAIFSITNDKDGNLWFGSHGGGVSKYDGKAFTNFTTAQGLANNSVFSITEDKSGNLWFGTYSSGVSKYDGKAFTNFIIAQELVNSTISSITEDNAGNLWFGVYGGGVRKYDGKCFTNFTTAQGLGNNDVLCITKDKSGNLWFGTYGGGVSKYDGKAFTNFTTAQGLVDDRVENVTEDKSGNLWFGTHGGGVSKYNGKTFTNFTTAQGLADNGVFSVAEDKAGNLWFGTNGGGVSKYDGKAFTNFTTAQGLTSNVVFNVTEDKIGNLWFATENGLCYFEPGSGILPSKKPQIKNYTMANGLPDNYITQVLQLANGKMAVGTNVGIAVFNPTLPLGANGKLADLELFNASTGYPIKDVNTGQHCMYQDSKGIIWTGTGEGKIGLVRFDYNAVNHNLKPPTVLLQNIKINEQTICYYTLDDKPDSTVLAQQELLTYNRVLTVTERDSIKNQFKGITFDDITRFNPLPQNLILPYEHNNITIEYNCVEVGKHFMVNYQYMLQGYDKDWSPILKKEEATYGNIDEGTYTFKLRAQSPDGIWCEPLEYTFNVLPPWYRTWWMYTVYAFLIIALIAFIVWWNGRKLRARAAELKEEVTKATRIIVEQKELVEEQKKIAVEKHKEITDSINYAERIQRSFLASKQLLDDNLKDYFVFFQPKDVVSGDFYWATRLSSNKFLLATADSTGHGVPGAIMSLLNVTSLEKACESHLQPTDILNSTRKTIIERLKKDGSEQGGKDGMDCSLISFDFTSQKFTYSAANNPVWVVRNNQLIELKPDKMPIGRSDKDAVPFAQHTFDLQKSDVVYTLTDGMPDQFGGPKGKKFMYKQLKNLLVSISHLPMQEQKESLKIAFNNWKGNLEQVDDVCLIGIRI